MPGYTISWGIQYRDVRRGGVRQVDLSDRRKWLMAVARDNQLDALRAIAVTMVLYSHFLAPNGSSFWGHIGVRLFFVLSGFLITRLLLEARAAAEFEAGPALRSFYIRRALRI